jgi:hypothetical protein
VSAASACFPLWGSHHLRQIRTLCRALIAHIASLLLRTIGGDLIALIDHLGIASALLDQACHRIATFAPALVAGDMQHIELADQVVEDDRADKALQGITGKRLTY